jgi:alkylation response protein AidB-like acyl-CoA dehydrogenase
LAVVFSDLVEELGRSGSPLGEHDLFRIGTLRSRLFALEAQCERIVERMLDAPDTPSAHDSFNKAFLTGFEQEMLAFAEESLGAYSHVRGRSPRGLNSERWIHDYYYGRAASIYGGTAQVQRNIIAERHLGLPKEPL